MCFMLQLLIVLSVVAIISIRGINSFGCSECSSNIVYKRHGPICMILLSLIFMFLFSGNISERIYVLLLFLFLLLLFCGHFVLG